MLQAYNNHDANIIILIPQTLNNQANSQLVSHKCYKMVKHWYHRVMMLSNNQLEKFAFTMHE